MEKPTVKSDALKNSELKDKHDNVKKSGEKKPTDSTRKFAILSSECINVIAESIGISDLPEDVQAGLAEDASYKLREVIHNCNIMLKNTKRRKLLTDDVNRVFQVLNVPAIYGHLSADQDAEFTFVEGADVFVENDSEEDIVEMAFSDMEFTQMKDQYVKGTWAVVEPNQLSDNKDTKQKDSSSNPKPGTSSESATSASKPALKPGEKPEDPPGASRPPSHLLNYYLQVAKVIISGSTPLLEIALNDLRTNPNVSPVCPYLLNLVALSVNKLQRHAWLTDALLSTVKALVENQFVDPSCYLAANRAANSLLVIAIEPKIASNCDDLLLRSRAAELLSKVLLIWTIEMKQQMDIVRQLLQLLLDKNISLQSQYGAIACLISLGYRILFMYFWPVMERYFPLLEEKYKTSSSSDIAHVKGAIMMAAEMMYRKEWSSCTLEESKRRLRVDYMLSEYFGDSLIPRRQQYTNPLLTNTKANISVKNTIFNTVDDFDFDYQNWSPSYLIQRRLPYMQNTKPANPYVINNLREPVNITTVFDIVGKLHTDIIFNFQGSNQIDGMELRRKRLDPKHIRYQCSLNKLSSLWYKQNIYKNTRNIKYCRQRRNFSGRELFIIL